MKFSHLFIISLIFVFLSFAPTAMAYDVSSTLQMIDGYAMQTGMDQGEVALLRAHALFEPAKVPAYLRIDRDTTGTWFCATSEILTIKEMLKNASPEIKVQIDKYLQPTPSTLMPKATKAGLGYNPRGYFASNSYQTEHFNFMWGPNTTYTLADMTDWGVFFEEIWDGEVVAWGFDPVLLSDTYYIDIYLGNSGDEVPNIGFSGAYTTVYYDNYQPYMVFHPDILSHEGAIKDVSSHEFFHTLQFTIAFKPGGCYQYMGDANGWGIEGTAVWAEDHMYNDLNYYSYMIGVYADNPFFALDTENFQHIYSRVLWWKYVSENFGGLQAIYDLWNDGCYGTIFNSINEIFKAYGTSVEEEFPKYALANLFMTDYLEGALYPVFHIQGTVSSYPDTYVPIHNREPQLFGTNYIQLNPPATKAADDTLSIVFEGQSEIEDRSVDWAVQIVAMTGTTTQAWRRSST